MGGGALDGRHFSVLRLRGFDQSQISSTIQSMIAAAERIFGFLEEPEEVEDVKNPI